MDPVALLTAAVADVALRGLAVGWERVVEFAACARPAAAAARAARARGGPAGAGCLGAVAELLLSAGCSLGSACPRTV